MIKESVIDKYLELEEEVSEAADKLLTWYHENIKEIDGFKFLHFESADDGEVHYVGEDNWRYGGHEDYSHSLPLDLLYDKTLRDGLEQETKVEKKKAERKAKKEENRKKKETEEEEKKTLAKLKKKYEV